MVLIRLDVYQVLRVLELCGTFTSTWPFESTVGRRRILLRELYWTLVILDVLGSISLLVLGALHVGDDIIRIMTALSELTALIEVLFDLILCRIGRSQLQKLLEKLKEFWKHIEPQEERVIQKYIDRYSDFFVFVGISYIVAAIAFSCGPLFLSIDLPMEAWYPFPIDAFYVRGTLYVLQVFAILQTAFCITVDFMIAMFFWFASARLEMLCEEFQQATNGSQVKICIRKHQEILRYRPLEFSFVDEVQSAVRYLICKTNITMASAVICGAFPLTHEQSLGVTAQFLCMVLGGCQRLYVTAWPADDLAEVSQQVAWAAYSMRWYETPREVASNLYIFIQRSKKPLQISMGGIFPVLSLQYYANFLKAISSYFMTMRAAIAE